MAQALHGEGLLIAFVIVFLGVEVDIHDQSQSDEYTWGHTALEQVPDGGGGSHSVKDQRNARRNDDAQGTGCGDQNRCKSTIIAFFNEHGDHHAADGCHGGRTGSGDGREEHRGHDGGDGRSAVHTADKDIDKVKQPPRDAAFAHELAGQNEERYGHEGKAVRGADHALGDEGQRQAG